jgi:hypothetical protein
VSRASALRMSRYDAPALRLEGFAFSKHRRYGDWLLSAPSGERVGMHEGVAS